MYIRLLIVVAIIVISIAAVFTFVLPKKYQNQEPYVRQVCPEAWYENRMPGPNGGGGGEQYFIVNGERVEVYEMDIAWVKANCAVNMPQPVY